MNWMLVKLVLVLGWVWASCFFLPAGLVLSTHLHELNINQHSKGVYIITSHLIPNTRCVNNVGRVRVFPLSLVPCCSFRFMSATEPPSHRATESSPNTVKGVPHTHIRILPVALVLVVGLVVPVLSCVSISVSLTPTNKTNQHSTVKMSTHTITHISTQVKHHTLWFGFVVLCPLPCVPLCYFFICQNYYPTKQQTTTKQYFTHTNTLVQLLIVDGRVMIMLLHFAWSSACWCGLSRPCSCPLSP
jgi:hypothetical protein